MHYNSRLAATIAGYCQNEGINETPVAGLNLYQLHAPPPRQPAMYAPAICIVAQGRKQLYFGDQTRAYDPDNYLINSVSMPLEAEVHDVTDDAPYLGLSLEIESYLVSQLLIEMELQNQNTPPTEDIIVSTAVSERLNDSVIRLLNCLDNPMDTRVLAPALKREIFMRCYGAFRPCTEELRCQPQRSPPDCLSGEFH